MIIVTAYIISTLLSFVALWILLVMTRYQKVTYYVLLFTTNIVVNIAYLALSISTTESEALCAVKFSYFDGTFLCLFMILCMCQICHIKIKTWWTAILVLLDIEILFSVYLTGYIPWHFKSVTFMHENGYSYLLKEYGPHHSFYNVYLIFITLLPLVIVIYSFMQKKQVSWIYVLLLAISQICTILIYFIETALSLKVELLPFSYVIGVYIVLFIVRRMSIYDISMNAHLSHINKSDLGYVILSADLCFIGCDEIARLFFPEFNQLAIDRPIDEPFLKQEFEEWTRESLSHPVDPRFYMRNNAYVKVTVQPFYSNSRKHHAGFIIQIYDDSQTQQYIKQLKEANTTLEQLAKEADAANVAKSEFLSLMSHEIRTPLNVILGMNDMILKESDNAAIISYANDISGAGQMLLSIINDILDISKIESGKMELINGEYHLGNFIHSIHTMTKVRLNGKQLNLQFTQSDALPSRLYGDETKMLQIVMNLVTNAIKYTDTGSVHVAFESTASKEPAILNLKISVSDTGRGILPENLDKLFVSFARFDEIKNHGIEGTGLGLSITKSFVEMMGGSISVESEYGKGSVFTVLIPQKIIDSEEIGHAAADRNNDFQTGEGAVCPRVKSILAVDDTKLNLKLFKLFLKDFDILIDTALSGGEALQYCYEKKYDMIFLDHMMPNMDGIECLMHIKNDAASLNKEVPVIILTANAIAGAREDYLAKGFSGYMAKPFKQENLIDMLNGTFSCQ